MTVYDTNFLVKKRNGSLVSFEKGKIKDAIYKCLLSCDDVKNYNLENLTDNVCKAVSQYNQLSKINDTENKDFVDVELIQDIVENILVGANLPQAAKSYILYRNKRSELRNQRLPGLPKEVIADFIHVAKYSQYNKEVFRREVHGESIDRVQNMHIEKFPQIENDIRWAFNKVRDRVSLPSMRSMQFGGKGVKAINERIYNCSFSPCNRFSFFKEAFFLLLCGCGTGFSVQKHHVAQLAPLKHINKDKVRHHIVEDTIQGWADALHALIMSYVEGDYYTEFSYSQIRGKGSYLSTSGGRAPGHFPLKLAIRRIRKLLDSVQGRHLRPIECHDIVCLASEAVLAGGVRRCLAENSRVLVKDSGYKSIQDIKIGDLVSTPGGWKPVTNVFIQGVQDTIRINHKNGYLQCTPNHRVAVMTELNKYEWRYAGDLEPGDRLISVFNEQEGKKTFLPNDNYEVSSKVTVLHDMKIPEIDDSLAWFFGYFHGNGYVYLNDTHGSIHVAGNSNNLEMMEKAKEQLSRFGIPVKLKKLNGENTLRASIHSRRLATWFLENVKKPHESLKVPSWIKEATTSLKAAYVQGLMDADGSVKTRNVQLASSIYPEYLKDIQSLLGSMGITSRLKLHRKAKETATGKWNPLWNLNLVNRDDRVLYDSLIPEWSFKRIPEYMFKVGRCGDSFNTKILKTMGNLSEFKYRVKINTSSPRTLAATFYDIFGQVKYKPIEVVSVTEDLPVNTYDIEVEDEHCFMCEGLLVHNSASISLFSIDDEEMINAKTGEWWKTHPWRSRANNSAVLLRSQATFEQYSRLFRSTKEYGEPGFLFVDNLDYGTNPCFHPDTRISTSKGWMKIGDMEKNGIPLCVNTDTRVGKGDLIFPELKGNKLRKATSAFLTKKSAEVFEIQTEHGQRLKVTENHKFPTFNGRKETHELSVGDTLLLNSGSVRFGREGSWDQGFILGMLTGDGCFSGKSAFIDIWESDFELSDLLHKIVNDQRELFKLNNKNDLGWIVQNHGSKKRIGGANFNKVVQIILKDQPTDDLKKMVPEVVWKGTKEMVAGYIAGMIVSDGTVLCSGKDKKKTVSLRISQVNRDLLEDIQNLLMGFGIVSKVYRRTEEAYRKLPDGKGGHKDYLCQPMHELIISRPNCITFENTIKLPGAKGRRLTQVLDERGRDCNKPERHITKIVSITKMDERTDVYCLTQPETNSVIANGIVSGNCSEVQFNPFYVVDSKAQIFLKERNINVNIGDILCGWSFCNLSEVNVAACKTEEEFLEAVTAATIIGTCQAGYTDFPYLGPVTELLARRDALLGVSMTGMVDNPAIAFNADLQRRAALLCKEVNEKYSALLGINSAARLTVVKPSGTASLALGCVGSGIHPHHAKRYFRRVRMSPGEAVYQFFKSINPHMCEKVNDTEDVITFCVEAPEGAVTRNDMTALEFLERVFLTQTNWIAYGTARDSDNPGLKNNVSNTVVVKPDEWEDVKHFLWDRRFQFSGISMLPYSGDKDYAFAPREEVVTEKDEFLWNNIVSNFKPVNYEFMLELEDGTSFQGEAACSAGGCEQ